MASKDGTTEGDPVPCKEEDKLIGVTGEMPVSNDCSTPAIRTKGDLANNHARSNTQQAPASHQVTASEEPIQSPRTPRRKRPARSDKNKTREEKLAEKLKGAGAPTSSDAAATSKKPSAVKESSSLELIPDSAEFSDTKDAQVSDDFAAQVLQNRTTARRMEEGDSSSGNPQVVSELSTTSDDDDEEEVALKPPAQAFRHTFSGEIVESPRPSLLSLSSSQRSVRFSDQAASSCPFDIQVETAASNGDSKKIYANISVKGSETEGLLGLLITKLSIGRHTIVSTSTQAGEDELGDCTHQIKIQLDENEPTDYQMEYLRKLLSNATTDFCSLKRSSDPIVNNFKDLMEGRVMGGDVSDPPRISDLSLNSSYHSTGSGPQRITRLQRKLAQESSPAASISSPLNTTTRPTLSTALTHSTRSIQSTMSEAVSEVGDLPDFGNNTRSMNSENMTLDSDNLSDDPDVPRPGAFLTPGLPHGARPRRSSQTRFGRWVSERLSSSRRVVNSDGTRAPSESQNVLPVAAEVVRPSEHDLEEQVRQRMMQESKAVANVVSMRELREELEQELDRDTVKKSTIMKWGLIMMVLCAIILALVLGLQSREDDSGDKIVQSASDTSDMPSPAPSERPYPLLQLIQERGVVRCGVYRDSVDLSTIYPIELFEMDLVSVR